MISRDRIRQVLERMTSLGIHSDDLEESFVRGSGAGGQKINKTSSTVVLKHRPTGLEVRCQQERSLTQNRFLARAELCEKLEQRRQTVRLNAAAARSKKRAQARKRSPGEKRAMIQEKRLRGQTKRLRGKPSSDD
jgi:peptide chain release factor